MGLIAVDITLMPLLCHRPLGLYGSIQRRAALLVMRAPVSSGQSGRERPAGIFSIIQKDAEHHSNLYDDAYMPHSAYVVRHWLARWSSAGTSGLAWLRSSAV